MQSLTAAGRTWPGGHCAATARLHAATAAWASRLPLFQGQRSAIITYASSAAVVEASPYIDQPSPQVCQRVGGWYLQSSNPHPCSPATQHAASIPAASAPTVTLVDGHSLFLSRMSQGLPAAAAQQQAEAWLHFLQLYTRAHLVVVAFDNKGSAAGNARAQLLPGYLNKRYRKQPPPGGTPATQPQTTTSTSRTGSRSASSLPSSWSVNPFDPRWGTSPRSAASTATSASSTQQVTKPTGGGARPGPASPLYNSSVPTDWQQAVEAAGAVAAHAAPGYEADDMLAALVQWCRRQQPAPLVYLVSADSDLWQLTGTHTYWLQLIPGPTSSCLSGLQLHSAAGFQQQHGYPPELHGDVLALTGKPAAGIPGAGVSRKAGRQLLARHGPISHLLNQLAAPRGPPPALRQQLQQLWGRDLNAAKQALEAAQHRLPIVQLQPDTQVLPDKLQTAYVAAAAQAQQEHGKQLACSGASSGPSSTSGLVAAAAGAGASDAAAATQQLALLHPTKQQHLAQCRPYLELLRAALCKLGLTQVQEAWLSPEGFLFDLVVQQGPITQQQQPQQQATPTSAADSIPTAPGASQPVGGAAQGANPSWHPSQCWVLQVVAPQDFKAAVTPTPAAPNTGASSSTNQVAGPGLQLRQQLSPCQGRLTGPLKARLRGSAAGQVQLYLRGSWRVILVPFHELMAADTGSVVGGSGQLDGSSVAAGLMGIEQAAAYLAGLLVQHGANST